MVLHNQKDMKSCETEQTGTDFTVAAYSELRQEYSDLSQPRLKIFLPVLTIAQ